MSAAAFKDRLRADIKAALQVRDSGKAATLRRLLGALDNAEAVEVADTPYRQRAFGDPAGEVARRVLDGEAIAAVVAREVAERRSAANDYERHGRADQAERLRAEAALISSYSQGAA